MAARTRLARVGFATGLARAAAALGGTLLPLAVGRYFGAAGLGQFTIAQTVCALAVIVGRGGGDEVLVRAVSQAEVGRDAASARAAAQHALRRSLTLSAVLTAAVLVWVLANPGDLIGFKERRLLLIMAPSAPLAAAAWQLSGFFKGLSRPARAVLFESGGAALLAAVLFVAALEAGARADVLTAGHGFLWANAAVTGLAWWCYRRWQRRTSPVPVPPGARAAQETAWRRSSRQFLIIHVATHMTSAGSLLVAGFMLPDVEVGLLRVAERLAASISLINLAVNPIVAPRFAAAFHRGRLDDLAALARRVSLLCGSVGLPVAVVGFIFARPLLSLVQSDAGAAAPYLRVMLLGQIVHVATGAVEHLLTMTRYEQVQKRVAVSLLVVGPRGPAGPDPRGGCIRLRGGLRGAADPEERRGSRAGRAPPRHLAPARTTPGGPPLRSRRRRGWRWQLEPDAQAALDHSSVSGAPRRRRSTAHPGLGPGAASSAGDAVGRR